MILEQLAALVADAGALETWQLSDDELRTLTRAVHQTRASLDELAVRLAQAAGDRELPRTDGGATTTAWLAHLTGISRTEAARLASLARVSTDLVDDTRAQWAKGRITTEQAGIIMRALAKLPDWVGDDEVRVAQNTLLEFAARISVDDLRRIANHTVAVIDPDGADEIIGKQLEAQEKKAWDATRFQITPLHDGRSKLAGIIPTVQAGILATALEGLAAPRRRPPDEPGGALRHDQRIGRALCELIEHLPEGALPQAGGLAATVTIDVPLAALESQIGKATVSAGGEMSVSQTSRFVCNSRLVALLLDGGSRVVDVSPSKRLHDRSQRLAIAKRDGGCCWQGCDRPPAWCEAHHLRPFSEGGATTVDNGALFCFTHHHMLHDGDWVARRAPDGIVEIIPPVRLDPERRPRRHARFLTIQPRAA